MRDMLHNYDVGISVPVIAISADRTGAAIDLRGYQAATIEIHVGAFSFTGSHKIEWKLEHTSDLDGSGNPENWTAVTLDDVFGVDAVGAGGIIHANEATVGAGGQVARVGYRMVERFVRVIGDQTGTTTTAVGTAVVSRGRPHQRPTS